MRERNRRAREYSRLCRTRRWCRRIWVAAIVLWVMLLVLVAWFLTLPPVEEDVVQSPPTAEIVELEPENVLVCDITGCVIAQHIQRHLAGVKPFLAQFNVTLDFRRLSQLVLEATAFHILVGFLVNFHLPSLFLIAFLAFSRLALFML